MAKQKKEEEVVTLDSLEKKYGFGKPVLEGKRIVPTGSLALNEAMYIGGTVVGKIIELFGAESSGKSTLTLYQMREYQKAFPDRKVALLDYENSYDKNYARVIGVNVDDLLVYQPDTMEQGYDLIIDLVKNKFVSCVVVDSQTAATPKAVLEGEMEDSTIGLQARLNSKFCLKIKGLLNSNDVTLFFISQLRDMIGVSYGDPSVTTGGKAIKFYSDIRWKVRKSVDKDNEMNKTIVEVVKSKVGKPFGVAELGILWGVGIDRLGEIITYGTRFGFIEKTGAWLNVADTKFHGESNLREFLSDNDGLTDELETKINEKIYGTGISECENQEVDGE